MRKLLSALVELADSLLGAARKTFTLGLVVTVAALVAAPSIARAGAKLKIGDDTTVDLGFRLQALYFNTQQNADTTDPDFERVNTFLVRRARLRLGADVGQWMSMFIQTEFADDTTANGADMRIIDAWVALKYSKALQLYLGENMAPAGRENLTSSGALLAIDRPSIINKNLTWGTRARPAFNTETLYSAGLNGTVPVRDLGATLFGAYSFSPTMHLKYYAGVYEGATTAKYDSLRYGARVQVNFLDPEDGYYNSSTYLGKKKTFGIGATVDFQPNVERIADATAPFAATGDYADYTFYAADAFLEYPVGPGNLTAEAGWVSLNLDDAFLFRGTNTTPSAPFDSREAAGNGYYLQAGYLVGNVQPWALWEQFFADASGDVGSYDSLRVGLSYFFKGHNANVKAGYEIFMPKNDFPGTNESSKGTFVLGFFTTY